jgi:very-short-patch-repair endonuclease
MILCPICNPERNPDTSIEQTIEQILIDNNIVFDKHERSIIPPKELDFYIPEFNLAIECNGMFWHSGEKRKYIAIEKLEKCKQKNIKLLTFWEDDIKYRKEAVINIIKTNL